MSNDPNKKDPKPTPPNSQIPSPSQPASPDWEVKDDDSVFDLPLVDEGSGEIEAPLPALDSSHEGDGIAPPQSALPPPADSVPFEGTISSDDPASQLPIPADSVPFEGTFLSNDPASFTAGIPVGELPDLAHLPSTNPGLSDHDLFASATDSSDEIGNLEPIAPVAPASGWLDGDEEPHPPRTVSREDMGEEPLGVHQADLLDAPPAIESSDIFSSGPIPTATGADQSDVIAATAFAPTTPSSPDQPDRPSEIAIFFDKPPGGSTLEQTGGSGDLPMAEELTGSSQDLFDSQHLAKTPLLPESKLKLRDETADYGSSPIATPDASSILSDLSDPGEITFDESSSVRLDAPGVERTLSSNPAEGTEFDLTISEDPVPPELDAAAAEPASGEIDWRDQSSSDLFSNSRTSMEIELGPDSGRVVPLDPTPFIDEQSLTSSPSSIFSDEKIPGASGSKSSNGRGSDSVRIGRPADEEDAAVEFSDNPSADTEASSASLAGPPSPVPNPREPGEKVDFDISTKQTPAHSTELDQDSGRVDWNAAAIPNDVEATLGVPHEMLKESLAEFLKGDKKTEESHRDTLSHSQGTKDKSNPAKLSKKNLSKAAADVPEGSDPSIEIDWMAGSSSEIPAIAPEDYELETPKQEKSKDKTDRDTKRPPLPPASERGKKGTAGWFGGSVLGMVVASVAFAGIYFGGIIPNAQAPKSTQSSSSSPQQASTHEAHTLPTVTDAQSASGAGDHAKALNILDSIKATSPEAMTTEAKAAVGQARLFARLQALGKANEAIATGDDSELKKAREELQAVVDDANAAKTPEDEKAAVKAAIHLGLTYEVAGDRAKANEVYKNGIKNFPKFASTFEAAIDRLAATTPAPNGVSSRLTPATAEQLLFAITLLNADPAAKEDEEAGVFFWKAVNLATAGKYGDAVDELKKAKTAHQKQAKAMAGRGLNPLSDPLEQIFPRCCDDLKAYWELRSAIYDNKSIADLIKKEGVAKAMNELAVAEKQAVQAIKLMTELKEATSKVVKAEKDLKDAEEKYSAKEKEFLANEVKAKEALDKTEDKYQKADQGLKKNMDLVNTLNKELQNAKEELTKTETNFQKAELSLKNNTNLIDSLAKELQAVKLLPEKYDATSLLSAQKNAIARSNGPTLTALMSPGAMAIGGTGLSAGQLLDIAERLTKSEAAAKVASEKLATETKRLTTEREVEVKKLKDEHSVEMKRLTDNYAADMKNMMESYTKSTAKLKEDQLAELKKMADKFAIDVKRLTDENGTAIKKLMEGYEGKIKDLELAVAREKAAAEAMAVRSKTDYGNPISPAVILDLWLPQLSELRRVADADPALANATKVLATAPPDSEDAAKARTVAGMALLLKGDLTQAKDMFQAARSSPAYRTAAGKEWAKAADIGLASIADPLAAYRLPIEKPKKDVRTAARFLDHGISEYKAGRFGDAVKTLVESTKADPTNPVAWYYLGASHWALGALDQAKDDYRQGSEWEKQSLLTAHAISANLEPIQGPARDALTLARP
jgi:hypothetical protein